MVFKTQELPVLLLLLLVVAVCQAFAEESSPKAEVEINIKVHPNLLR